MDVMVVEDDVRLLEALQHHLTRAGFSVETASNGKQALEKLCAKPVELVITDWKMPEMTGVELCRAIRATPPIRHTYIIMLTGQSSEQEQLEGIHAGADDYLTKPFKMDRLLASVRIAAQMMRPSAA